MNITQEQWEKACARSNVHPRIKFTQHYANSLPYATYIYPPIGDPATVLQMLEWLEHQTDNGDFESVDGYFDIDKNKYCTRLGSEKLIRAYGYGSTKAEAVVRAVLALPEAGE